MNKLLVLLFLTLASMKHGVYGSDLSQEYDISNASNLALSDLDSFLETQSINGRSLNTRRSLSALRFRILKTKKIINRHDEMNRCKQLRFELSEAIKLIGPEKSENLKQLRVDLSDIISQNFAQ